MLPQYFVRKLKGTAGPIFSIYLPEKVEV